MRYIIILLAPLLAVLALACNGGGEDARPTPSPTVEQAAPTVTPESAAETLAFIRDGDIWLIDADGSNERQLGLSDVKEFSWVSSEELDVVIDGDPSDAIDGDEPGHLLVDTEGNVSDLPFPAGGSWSRDGTMYVVPVDQQVVVFDREGGEVARLEVAPPPREGPKPNNCGATLPSGEPDPLVFGQPVFSPDGQRILVAVTCASRMGATGNLYASVYEAPLDGAAIRTLPLQTNLHDVSAPHLSPDGTRIAQKVVDQAGAGHREHLVYVINVDGAASAELTLPAITELRQQQPGDWRRGGLLSYDWSPASDAIVASFDISVLEENAGRQVVAGLYILNLDGSSQERLVAGATHSPAWSPSGRYIAYVAGEYFGEPTEPPSVRVLDLSAGTVTDLGLGSQPAWQP